MIVTISFFSMKIAGDTRIIFWKNGKFEVVHVECVLCVMSTTTNLKCDKNNVCPLQLCCLLYSPQPFACNSLDKDGNKKLELCCTYCCCFSNSPTTIIILMLSSSAYLPAQQHYIFGTEFVGANTQ